MLISNQENLQKAFDIRNEVFVLEQQVSRERRVR